MKHAAGFVGQVLLLLGLVVGLGLAATGSRAQGGPLDPGWDLDPAGSSINFGSKKFENGKDVIETHSFATFSGSIEPDGKTVIKVKLDSVNTNNDLRNVRMRFLFFETFKFPEASVTAQVTPDMAAGVAEGAPKSVKIPFDLSIHGTSGTLVTDALVTVEGQDRIVVASASPTVFRVDDFGLGNNLRKIAETAGGFQITPEMTLTYKFAFSRRGAGGAPAAPAVADTQPPAAAAIETKGEFSYEECVGRFQILSETGNIYFASGSAELDRESTYVLNTVLDIVNRCPGLRILVSGHTDDIGSTALNQALSERRARSVVDFLARQGVDPSRLFSTGFGKERPMVANDSDFNRSRNRRIEFSLYK